MVTVVVWSLLSWCGWVRTTEPVAWQNKRTKKFSFFPVERLFSFMRHESCSVQQTNTTRQRLARMRTCELSIQLFFFLAEPKKKEDEKAVSSLYIYVFNSIAESIFYLFGKSKKRWWARCFNFLSFSLFMSSAFSLAFHRYLAGLWWGLLVAKAYCLPFSLFYP